MPHIIQNKSRLSAISALTLIALLTCVSFANAIVIKNGETRTTQLNIDDGDNVTIEEGGAIKTTGGGEHGIDGDDAEDTTVNNYGLISTTGDSAHGIFLNDDADDNIINNFGTIKTTGEDSDGIRLNDDSEDNIINNYGNIKTTGNGSNGIRFVEDDDGTRRNTINNYKSGHISTRGNDADAISVTDDHNNISINNYGSIGTVGDDSHGIYFNDDIDDSTINNFRYGSIMTSGTDSRGIFFRGTSEDNILRNHGKIVTSGDGDSHAIQIDESSHRNIISNFYTGRIQVKHSDATAINITNDSDDTIINNRGRILAASPSGIAISESSSSNRTTLNIGSGSKIVGEIIFAGVDDIINIDGKNFAGSSSTLSFSAPVDTSINTFGRNVLKANVGRGYYSLVDPSGQSAKGAAMGTLTDGIHTAITERLGRMQLSNPTQVASTRVDTGMMPERNKPIAWVTAIGQHRSRENDAQVMAYDHDYYGGVGGFEMNFGNIRAGAMVGYARSDFATDLWSIQTDTDSFFAGVYGQMELGWLNVSSTLMGGYEDISNDRLVVDNLNGFETAEADYDNFFLSPSITLSAPLKVNSKTVISPSLTGTYAVGFQDGYSESGTTRSNLTIEDRTIHAFMGRAQVAVAHRWTNSIDTVFRAGFKARQTSNGLINATLAGSSFQYSTSGDDTVMGGFFGVNGRYRVTDSINVMLDGEYTMNAGDETSINGQLGAEFLF